MNEFNSFKISPLLNSQFAVIDETIYVSSNNYNGLYAVDITSGRLRFIGKFLNQGNFDTLMFGIRQFGRKLFFVPGCAHEIAFYDLDAKQIKEIPMNQVFTTNTIVISVYAVIDDILYLFPAQATSIILYSMKYKKVIDTIDIVDIYKKVFGVGYVALSATDTSYLYQNKIYIPCWMHSAFMSFDLESRNIEFYKVTGCGQGFCSLCGVDNTIYALSRSGILVKWDIHTKKVIDMSKIISDSHVAEVYRNISLIGEYLYLVPDSGILKIIKTDLNMHIKREGLPNEVTDILGREYSDETVYIGCIHDEKMYCYTDKNRYFCVDMQNEAIEWVRTVIYDSEELKNAIFDATGIQEKCKVIQETSAISVSELIEMVCNDHKMEKKEQSYVGDKIYRTILK